MSLLLADIDATCAALGFFDGTTYHIEPDTLQGLKVFIAFNIALHQFLSLFTIFQHLIWILRRDNETHEYRRHLGRGKVLQTDLLPMVIYHTGDEDDMSDVLLRLLVNLTNPALLLYREELPKDGPGRRHYLELIEILQGYVQLLMFFCLHSVLNIIFMCILCLGTKRHLQLGSCGSHLENVCKKSWKR